MDDSRIQNSLVPLLREEAKLLLEAGYLWMEMGQPEKAREVFVGTAQLMPKSEVPQLALGTLELALGRPEKALQSYRAAQKLAPGSGLPRAHVGEALLLMGKLAEARKELKAAVEIEPSGDGARFAQALLSAVEAGAFEMAAKGN